MNELQKQRLLDYALKRATRDDLLRAFEPAKISDPKTRAQLLRVAMDSANADQVEYALLLIWTFGGPTVDDVPILNALLEAPWHKSHEETARALEQLADESSVHVLYRVALMKFDYLAYNNSNALARKCTWAIAKIATPEAMAKLEELSRCGDAEIEAFARKRLRHH